VPKPSALRSLQERLFAEPYSFDFFQAVRILRRMVQTNDPEGKLPREGEVARFRAHVSLGFPPSAIYDLVPAIDPAQPPAMTVTFLGLTGPSGVLPVHYTELLIRQQRGDQGHEQFALRDWLDLFNHRLTELFYQAWAKYRFWIAYEEGQARFGQPDPFTNVLYSLVGLNSSVSRNRLQVYTPAPSTDSTEDEPQRQVWGKIDDLATLYYSGFFAQRPRCAISLEALLRDYFKLPVKVVQFLGQWLQLEPSNQSVFGEERQNNQLGVCVVAGERVWDVQGKFRIRIGPLSYAQFAEFIPDRSASAQGKSLFLLTHLTRLYVGSELAFDVQAILRAADVPVCQLTENTPTSPRLGWNTWVFSLAFPHDAEDACFEAEEVFDLQRTV
jgi:type VI secretion system protein ImpH